MPGLGLGEERLHPDSPLAHRLLVGRSRVMAAHRLQVVGVEGPMDDAAMLTFRAFRLEWTGVAGGGRGTVQPPPRHTWPFPVPGDGAADSGTRPALRRK